MKRAPVIPKHTLNTQPVEDTSLSTPAAPMVDYFACMWSGCEVYS